MNDEKRIAARIFIPDYGCFRPLDWNAAFGADRPLNVEIGFGLGEYLLSCVEKESHRHYIGIERDWGRIQKCFKKAAQRPTEAQRLLESRLRIVKGDAWAVFERMFRPRTVAGMVCLFPCPWPKDRHERHRLFSREFLLLLNSRLEDDGRLQCVTDDRVYADWILDQAQDCGFHVSERIVPPVFGTKFERKWFAGGQDEFYEILFRKETHQDVPLKEDVELKAFYHSVFVPDAFNVKEEAADGAAIVPKEWLFDPSQAKGMVRLIVSEEHLTQHMWVVIIKAQKGWCVLRAEGQNVLPTPGTARAIELVSEAVARTAETPGFVL